MRFPITQNMRLHRIWILPFVFFYIPSLLLIHSIFLPSVVLMFGSVDVFIPIPQIWNHPDIYYNEAMKLPDAKKSCAVRPTLNSPVSSF